MLIEVGHFALESTYSHTFIVFLRANILQDFLSLISLPEVKLMSNI